MCARAPKELLHHLPALILHRPSDSAGPTGLLSGARGSRLLDRRPPHYRCPAVPGLSHSARAIPMAPRSSVLSLLTSTFQRGTAYCWHCSTACCVATCGSVALRQPAPSPVVRPLLRLRTPLPNLPVRAPAADAFTEVPLTFLRCWIPRTALAGTATSPAVLLVTAPDHCGPPGPVVSPVAVLRQPWLRNSTTAPSCQLQLPVILPGSSCLPGPADLDYERNHIQTINQCLLQPTQIF